VAQFEIFILVIPRIRRSSAGRGIWRGPADSALRFRARSFASSGWPFLNWEEFRIEPLRPNLRLHQDWLRTRRRDNP